ncbi:inorganic diphosphatase [Lysinibacillus parviboronicapiens]|uniref:inorganic diphosphatase n=1 Tax=Lysinibacillus parviboronicapiens TaxID=436516 RepID=A0ABV2PKP6_9BACI|nr:inorganic diphosphatase [Lysinibacillus parviboronicapiens]
MIMNYLYTQVKVKVDRPLGSKHPKYNFVYLVNYGFIPNTIARDGGGIDAYILGEFEPLETYEGKVIAVIKRRDDIEDKLVVSNRFYTTEQICALIEFQERFFSAQIITEFNLGISISQPSNKLHH